MKQPFRTQPTTHTKPRHLLAWIVAMACLGACYIPDSPGYRRPDRAYSKAPAPAAIAIPARLHWCAQHCSTWVWAGDRYVDEATPNAARTPQCGMWIERFSPASIIMQRADCWPYPGRAVLTGRLSPDGNAILDGVITWTYHPCCGLGASRFVAAWGPAIDALPGNDAELARRTQRPTWAAAPAPRDVATPAPAPAPRNPGMADPAPTPRGSSDARDEQIATAFLKAVAALAVNAVASDPSNSDLQRFAARELRNAVVASALRDAFPDLSQRQAKDVAYFIGAELDGKLNAGNVAVHFTKQYAMDQLRAIDPNLADVAQLADFLYRLHGAVSAR